MGQEIGTEHFSQADFERYYAALQQETGLLRQWFESGAFSSTRDIAGFELEAWLVDGAGSPAPVNEAYLARLGDELVTPELSRFNVELNVTPEQLSGAALTRLHDDLAGNWRRCSQVAAELDVDLVMVGILPSVREDQLTLSNMSRMKRYRALNEQIFRQREGRPLQLDIVGREHLRTTHYNVMLEAATTSFQIHLQLDPASAARHYNAAIIASGPMVAVSANAPYLFGHDLWDETRIPLFEQSVEVGGYEGAAQGPLRRVSFGSGYVRHSLYECFAENLEHFPILLPEHYDTPPEAMQHVRLHNGTIWRWNRPLIGFDDDGCPHLRLEHRVVPGGPSIPDEIANAAFFYGLVHELARADTPPEQLLPFAQARDNFYAGARLSLDAGMTWLDGRHGPCRTLVLEVLLPMAREGLDRLGVDAADSRRWLDIIAERVGLHRHGAAWQRQWVAVHGRDFQALTLAYAEQQHQGLPVHQWPWPGEGGHAA